jgi:predicted ribonuclease YlaK
VFPIYSGVKEVILSDEQLATFYQDNQSPVELLENEYLIIKNQENECVDKYKFNNGVLVKLKGIKYKNSDLLKPLDEIQLCAYDALYSKDIKVVCLVGKSGTGKTKTAITIGLELLKAGVYDKILLIRHAVETGEGIGLLPGSKDDKMINGWAGCFYDNLNGQRYEFEDLVKQGKIEIESLSLLKGRDIKNSYVIFDECEDAYPDQIELVGTRLGLNSKGVFVGDYNQTSKERYKNNSGIKKLIEKATGKKWFINIELKTNGRSEVAEFFATEFKE